MDKRPRVIWAIRCILTVVLVGFILCVWPGYLAHDHYVSRTFSERHEFSDALFPQSVMTQYFVPQRSHLCGIEFAILFNEEKAGNEAVRFILCDEAGREIFSQEILLEQMHSGWYYNVEIDERLKAGETYSWTLECPDAEDIELRVMYTNHLADQAAENALFMLNDAQYGEITQTISQYTYLIHSDKIIIIGEYWAGAVLIYIICMDIVSRFPKRKQIQDQI